MTNNEPTREAEAQARQTARTLWRALLVSQVVYAGLVLSGVAVVRSEPLDLPLPILFAGVAAATALGAHFFWRRAAGEDRAIHEQAPAAAVVGTSYILAWVLDESIAIYGLLLGLLAFPISIWCLFSGAAFALMLLHRPR